MGDAGHDDEAVESFRSFVAATQRRLWLPLCMEVGAELADDAVAQSMAYAWQNWARIRAMANPEGYLYRAAQRYARRARPHRVVALPRLDPSHQPEIEPGLIDALAALSPHQRVAVFVIDGCGWTLAEAAALLDVSVSTVRNHRARGMARLRELLEVDIDV